ncbi:MAG: hypothetical protein ABEJ73_10435 [Haloplanus sp.]
MRRRAFLGAVGLTALAGCSNGGSGGSTATPTSTPAGTGSPNFEFLRVESAETTPLNVPTAFAIAIQNTGTAEGTFTSMLQAKIGDGEWKDAGTIEMTLAPGEKGEWHSPRLTPRYLTTLHYRLAAFDETWSIEVTPKRLDFGNYYNVPTGLYLNVLGGSFESKYPTPTDGSTTNGTATNGTGTPEPTPTPTTPPDGDIWAIMELEVRNRLDEPKTTPAASEFVLEVGGERRPLHQEVANPAYESITLDGRTIRRAELVYAVPEGTQAHDLTLWWEKSLPKGDVKAIWTK